MHEADIHKKKLNTGYRQFVNSDPAAYSMHLSHALRVVLFVSISLLLISTFRAPEGMEGLQSLIGKIKVLIRFSVLGVLGLLLLNIVRRYRLSSHLLWHLPFLAFAAWGMFSILWSARPSESFGQVISLLTLILVSLTVSIFLRREQDLSDLIRFITLNLMALCLFLLLTGLLIPASGHMTRSGLGLGHATNSGSSASLGLVCLLGCGALWNWRWIKTLMIPGCFLFVAVAIVSANRLSLAITAIIVPTVWLCSGSQRSIGWMLIAAMVAGNALLLIDPSFSGISDLMQTVNREQSTEEISSLSGRQQMWEAMWQSFRTSPLIGHGYFMSSKTGEMEVWFLGDEMVGVNWTAHNIWLQAMVSTGLIGLMLFVLALLAPITTLVLRAIFTKRWQIIDSWFCIMLAWYLFWGILNESFLGPLQPESVIFFLVYGTLVAKLNGEARFSPDRSTELGDTRGPLLPSSRLGELPLA